MTALSTNSRIIKPLNQPPIKPVRLNAWDAEVSPDGWALMAKDVKNWLEMTVAQTAGDHQALIEQLNDFISHLG